jgi:hypothetical protein
LAGQAQGNKARKGISLRKIVLKPLMHSGNEEGIKTNPFRLPPFAFRPFPCIN